MEGVMMRGASSMAVAVRQPDGEVIIHTEDLNPHIYTGRISKIPFLRALTSLWDVLVLGIRTLMFSADVALGEEEDVEFSGPVAWGTVAVSFALGIGLFFVVPLLLVGLIDRFIESSFLSNVIEGMIRMSIFIAYIWLISVGSWVVKNGLRHLIDVKSRRDKSYFRLGWDWLARCLRFKSSLPIRFIPYYLSK